MIDDELLDELRTSCNGHVTIHCVSNGDWCVHPYNDPNVEFRSPSFTKAVSDAVKTIKLTNIPELSLDGRNKLIDLLIAAGFADTKRAATRLISEGAVSIDSTIVTDPTARWTATKSAILQVGSRKFVRVNP